MQEIWLFQADPSQYDLAKQVRKGTTDNWELNQHRGHVNKGDTVILWQSGDEAGVYGFGKLAEKHGEDRIDIEYTERLKKTLLKRDILKHPVLGKLLVLRNPHSRNPYRITANEWQALKKLLPK